MPRLRIKYKRGEALRYVGHLDMMRVWHRALRRSNVPIAYSEGFNPRPKMVFAAPLGLGILSDAELLDITLTRQIAPSILKEMISRQLPEGLTVIQTSFVPESLPPMPAITTDAEYIVTAERTPSFSKDRIDEVLQAESIKWEQIREGVTKLYDIRTMFSDISVIEEDDSTVTLRMILKCSPSGAGRPEQIVKLLGLGDPISITRKRIIMQMPQAEMEQ